MKIFGLNINWDNTDLNDKIVVRTVTPRTIPVSKIPVVAVKSLSYSQQYARGRGNFQTAEYDLSEIGKIEDSVSGHRLTAVKIDGEIKTLTFSQLWEWASKKYSYCSEYFGDNKERIYIPEGELLVLSGKIIKNLPEKEAEEKKVCRVDNCSNKHVSRGMCEKHKSEYRRLGYIRDRIIGSWESCRSLIRHKVTKKGYHFIQKHGSTEVTEDHSLITFSPEGLQEFKPSENKPFAKISFINDVQFGYITEINFSNYLDFKADENFLIDDTPNPNNSEKLIKSTKIPKKISGEKIFDFMALLGAFISEGSTTNNGNSGFRISNTDYEWLSGLKSKFETLFPDIPCSISPTDSKCFALQSHRRIIARLFSSLAGIESTNKKIPDFVYQLHKEAILVLNKYMIDGDGNLQSYGWSYTTKSLTLASQYSFLLRLLGKQYSFNYKFKEDQIYYSIRTCLVGEEIFCKTWSSPFEYKDEFVYDLEVPTTHNFIDLAGQVLLHNTDGFVRQAFKKKEGLMFKEGFGWKGANKDTIRYLKTRLAQIAQASEIPTITLLKRTARSLIRTSNAFLLKVRDPRASGGKTRTTPEGKTFKPIAAYFPMAPETMRVDLDENTGKIRKWRQVLPDGRWKDYKPEDVIHFVIDRREGFLFGVPTIIPVIDDIRALRQIEENIELLLYQHLFPLFHYKVGTETAPAGYTEDGEKEVDIVEQQIKLMPSEGAIVTPERHEIKAIGAEGRSIRAEGYLTHFKKRVFAGLGVSQIDMGDGDTTNRATAQTLSRALIDAVKAIQDDLEAQWDQLVIGELLLESTFDDRVLEEDQMVHLEFAEIDIQNKMEQEQHAAEMFKVNGLTYDEFRAALSKEPILIPEDPNDQDPKKYPEWHQTYWKLFEEPLNLIRAVDEPYCQSKDTEILTEDGWKYFYELTSEDKVAVLANGKELVFEVPKERLEFDYEGKLYHLSTRFIDILVTPNHKLYVADIEHDRKVDLHPFKLKRADEVVGQYKKFKRTAQWIGQNPTYFILPELHRESKYHPSKKYFPTRTIDIKLWLRFLGWHLSEGWYGNHGQVGITQSENIHPEFSQEIYNILNYLELNPYPDDKGWVFSDFQIKYWLLENCGHYCHEKRIPKKIKQLSPELLEILLKTMMKGDGETKYHYLYSTTSKQLADDVQEIALKIGWAANIRLECRSNKNCRDVYRVGINIGQYADVADRCAYRDLASSSEEGWVFYKDKVYSVSTSTGIIYVRRNGKARWCGNSVAAQAAAEMRSLALTQKQQQTATKETEKATKKAAEEDRKTKVAVAKARPRPSVTKRKDHFLSTSFNDLESDTAARLRTNIISRGNLDKESLVSLGRVWATDAGDKLVSLAVSELIKGFNEQTNMKAGDAEILINMGRGTLHNRIDYRLNKLVENTINLISRRVDEHLGSVKLAEVQLDAIHELHIAFDAVRYRIDLIWDIELRKAYAFGRVLGMRFLDEYGFELQAHPDGCEQCQALDGRIVMASNADIDDVPPFHPHSRMKFKTIREAPGSSLVTDYFTGVPSRQEGKPAVAQEGNILVNTAICPECGNTATWQPKSGNYYCYRCKVAFQDEAVQDGVDKGKLERCVLEVKKQLREKHPDWDSKKIKSSAFAICTAQLKKG